ncbi:uncharacterized protein LOC125000570 isoform X2 [Mugil cephalus]|uniref:uncharacterized protein LOC125000570 isoform X2 n=1 Tax=Mugil cephalus TaxID=48193 RepID=UPI001FB7E311|nr:uncharacterized protein LOC125000570 isoform X2 [Mugil cephalus]
MGGGKLWFVLLLRLMFLTDSEVVQEYLEKTIGKEPDVTPLCTNTTENVISFIVCKIRTEMRQGEECRLLYQYGQDFVHECDSRFTLVKENHTVFLRVINLTPKESGNHICECTYLSGTHTLHLNITVKEDEVPATVTHIPLSYVYIGVTIFIIVICIILGCVYTKRRHGRQTEPITSQPNTILPTEAEAIEPYSVFIQTENGLYTTARIHSLNMRTNNMSNT